MFVSVWGLLFYRYLPFVVLTGNRKKREAPRAGSSANAK
jgi:hypothetical protein